MMKHPILIAALVLVCALSCGSYSQEQSITLASFVNEDGAFAYPGIAWGSSPEEVEKAAGIDFDDAQRNTTPSQNFSEYTFADNAVLFDYVASTKYEFMKNELSSVYLTFQDDERDMDTLIGLAGDALEELFGEPEASVGQGGEDGQRHSNWQRWMHTEGDETTSLQLGLLDSNGRKTVILFVGVLGNNP